MKPILYAEDSLAAQAIMRRQLLDVAEITVATSPEAALAMMAERRFAVLITDYSFAEGDALDLISHVRQENTPGELPIVVVSSGLDRVLEGRVLRAGANEAFSKPVEPSRFRSVIQQMLTEPYVRVQDKTITGVNCLQWCANGAYHQYCPDLDFTVSAPTREEANQKMHDVLTKRAAEKADIGVTHHEKLVSHVIES